MTVLNANPELSAYLAPLNDRTEIRDTDGKLIGIFLPADREQPLEYADVRKLFDAEEIKRRKARSGNDPGRPLTEIVKHLQSLENSP